jgi:hypothetical protein
MTFEYPDEVVYARAAEAQKARDHLAKALDLLAIVYDDSPCSFDHHGDCQAHGMLGFAPAPCPQVQIGQLLAAAG